MQPTEWNTADKENGERRGRNCRDQTDFPGGSTLGFKHSRDVSHRQDQAGVTGRLVLNPNSFYVSDGRGPFPGLSEEAEEAEEENNVAAVNGTVGHS